MNSEENIIREGQLSVAIHGAEVLNLALNGNELNDRNYKLYFLPYDTERRLSEFDGVITFQSLYESFKSKSSNWSSWTEHSCDRNELDKREKEVGILLNNGGFIAIILHRPFIDHAHQSNRYYDYRDTDLAKRLLNWRNLDRKNLDQRDPGIRCVRNEFLRFFQLYGAACSVFLHYGNMPWRDLAMIGGNTVSMVLADNIFFIPSLLPEKGNERKEEFYRLLSDAVITCFKKLRTELPAWADNFLLPKEQTLIEEQQSLSMRLDEIDNERSTLSKFKKVLVGDSNSLVEAVEFLLTEGLGYQVNSVDAYREDFKILSPEGDAIIFGEVKGTTRGVKREFINQADSHRERAGYTSDFPSLLVINTHIKNTRAIEEKDQEVPSEQIKHAAAMHVLIIRTLDLLNLLALVQKNQVSKEEILRILCKEVGWLRVLGDEIKIHVE